MYRIRDFCTVLDLTLRKRKIDMFPWHGTDKNGARKREKRTPN